MTTIVQAREAIYQAFVTGWADETTYVLENEVLDPAARTEWVRVSVRHNDAGQTSLGAVGNRRFLRRGMAVVQVFVAGDIGMQRLDQLCIIAKDIFEGITLAGTTVNFYQTLIREIPRGPEDIWQSANVVASFEYQEIR